MGYKREVATVAIMVFLAFVACAIDPFGMPYGQPREPSLYDQATGKARLTLFGPWTEIGPIKSPKYGEALLYRYHIMDMSKAMQASGKGRKLNPKDMDTQVIDFHYPYADILKAYKTEGATTKLFEFIKQKNPTAADDISNDRNFVYAGVTKGIGKGVSLALKNGKYHLWNGAPLMFGNEYDVAGMIVKEKAYYLFAMNSNDTSAIVFLSPTKAQRHYENGLVVDLKATSVESARIYLPRMLLIGGAAIAIVVVAIITRRLISKRYVS